MCQKEKGDVKRLLHFSPICRGATKVALNGTPLTATVAGEIFAQNCHMICHVKGLE